jgi:aminoglycoside 2''-phosphotransferase
MRSRESEHPVRHLETGPAQATGGPVPGSGKSGSSPDTRQDPAVQPNSRQLERIREMNPDLVLSRVEVNPDGEVHDVVIVNRERVFRFPKSDWARASLQQEHDVLDLVREVVAMPVPLLDQLTDDYGSYPYLPGSPLQHDLVMAQPGQIQDRLAWQIGIFMRQLHAIPMRVLRQRRIPTSETVRNRDDWLRLLEGVQRELFPWMKASVCESVVRHFQPLLEDEGWLRYRPALVHGDLRPQHILIEPGASQISGIIDFSASGVGDAAVDVACLLYHYGESFVVRMGRFYPGIGQLIDRARFWAGTLELQWALAGLRSSDPSWLVAHIGGARDISPVGSPWWPAGGG